MAARRDFTRESLAAGVRAGDKRALARAITLVENSEPLAYDVVAELY
ncbi:MAG: methylmalonyl Co-A mutase-associated GTPase MeaB, partial [Actinobacteria bacterium]